MERKQIEIYKNELLSEEMICAIVESFGYWTFHYSSTNANYTKEFLVFKSKNETANLWIDKDCNLTSLFAILCNN